MDYYVKEKCYLENGETVVNIFRCDEDNTWYWIVLGNEYHSHPGNGPLTDVLIAHMEYVRYLEKGFGKSREYDILTNNQVEEELFCLGI